MSRSMSPIPFTAIIKTEINKPKGSTFPVYNLLLKDLPKQGEKLLITGLAPEVFQALQSSLGLVDSTFALTYTAPTHVEGDPFYTATFDGRFEVYPSFPQVEVVNVDDDDYDDE